MIQEERFHVTPVGMFSEIMKNAEAVLRRSAGEEKMRQAWLVQDGDDEEHDGAAAADNEGVDAPGSREDAFGCNPDRVCPPGGPRPPYLKEPQQQQQTTATLQTFTARCGHKQEHSTSRSNSHAIRQKLARTL